MNWRNFLVREYAGHPLRVAFNLLTLASTGIVLGYWGLNAPLGDGLVMAAMIPGLVAVVSAAIVKEKYAHRRA